MFRELSWLILNREPWNQFVPVRSVSSLGPTISFLDAMELVRRIYNKALDFIETCKFQETIGQKDITLKVLNL